MNDPQIERTFSKPATEGAADERTIIFDQDTKHRRGSQTVESVDSISIASEVIERQTIGRYTILTELGRGGQASVYRGVHPTLPLEVAIKLSHQPHSISDRKALLEEAQILCDLEHPNIARVRDFDFDDGRPFMVLDFIRGRSLRQVIETKPLTPVEAATMVAKLARAIDYAHGRGVLHRDLKPDNVVIDQAGEPRIIDFGMSRLRNGLTGWDKEPNEISGTLNYMAPEQALGDPARTDHRIDIYALGATLYRLLIGKSPHPKLPRQKLWDRVCRGEYDQASLAKADLPESIKAIVRRAMDVDPNVRFETGESLAEALEQAIAEMTPPRSGKLAAMLEPVFAKVAAVLLSLSLCLGFIYAFSISSSPSVTQRELAGNFIERFDIIHIGNSADRAEFSGSLLQFGQPMENDDLQVHAKFNRPVYCFLVALNPDGVKQLCYPTHESTRQTEPIETLKFPEDETIAFGLTDGVGQQAFVLYASKNPLPSYDQWNRDLVETPWPPPGVSGNWRYQGGELQAFSRDHALVGHATTRGKTRPVKTPTSFKRLCDGLRESDTTDVEGIMFEVRERPDT